MAAMTPLQAVRASNLTDNVMECIRHVVEKHDAALLEVAIELRKENEALRALLAGFDGPPPTPLQWTMICEKARELQAALREGK
jgi:hypothetical protein